MTTTLDAFLDMVRTRPGANEGELREVERFLGQRLPSDYRAFLEVSNGAEGFLALGQYFMLWSLDELQSLNKDYAVHEFLPGAILIGTNGGDTGFGFTSNEGTRTYFDVPLIGMDASAIRKRGNTFEEFLGSFYGTADK